MSLFPADIQPTDFTVFCSDGDRTLSRSKKIVAPPALAQATEQCGLGRIIYTFQLYFHTIIALDLERLLNGITSDLSQENGACRINHANNRSSRLTAMA